jgi:hypothetical protein
MRKLQSLIAITSIGLSLASAPSVQAETKPKASDGKTCMVVGTSKNDTLVGTKASDVICGLGGNDTIYGLGGNDTVDGGTGNDILYGGTGNDILYGGTGNDKAVGGAGGDRLLGGSDADTLLGGAGADAVNGEAGKDVVAGGEGKDTVIGGTDSDICNSEKGAVSCEIFDTISPSSISVKVIGSSIVKKSSAHPKISLEISYSDRLSGINSIGLNWANGNGNQGSANYIVAPPLLVPCTKSSLPSSPVTKLPDSRELADWALANANEAAPGVGSVGTVNLGFIFSQPDGWYYSCL